MSEKEKITFPSEISDEVIAICVINAAQKTRGFAQFGGGLSNALSQNILGKERQYKGIKILNYDDGLHIDILIYVEYGSKIPTVAWDIQTNVKREIKHIAGITPRSINVHVQGVKEHKEKTNKQ